MKADKKLWSIGEVAEEISTTPAQIKRWEKQGLMPKASGRVRKGQREDRRYTAEQVEQMRRLRQLFQPGAPTPEATKVRERVKKLIESEEQT